MLVPLFTLWGRDMWNALDEWVGAVVGMIQRNPLSFALGFMVAVVVFSMPRAHAAGVVKKVTGRGVSKHVMYKARASDVVHPRGVFCLRHPAKCNRDVTAVKALKLRGKK